IGVGGVPVIALLAALHDSVSARGQRAIVRTRVVVVRVAVITSLYTCLHEAVATGGGDTGGEAAVGVALVSVIAFFVSLDHAVAPALDGACRRTAVPADRVAVVARFTQLDLAVPAHGARSTATRRDVAALAPLVGLTGVAPLTVILPANG